MRPPGVRAAVARTAALLILAACAGERYDLVLFGGTVVDGSGGPRVRADVGIRGDGIAAVGDLRGARAVRRLDATGLVVAPGFIDPHTHARGNLLEIPTADPYIRQGVTTLVDGNDGGSPFPIAPFLDTVQAHGVSANFALFVGHGTIRQRVMGREDREPTGDELERMKEMVARGMEEGALGISTGLAYVPGSYATTEEVVELSRVAAAYGGVYISHMRDEGAGVLRSVEETIRIGREAGIPVQMTHHKVGGHRQWGQSARSIEMMREARANGVDVTFDQYPYTASSTGLSFLVPAWAQAGDGLEARLADPELARRIRNEMLDFLDERFAGDPSRVQLVSCGFDPSLAGKTLADVLSARGAPLSAEATVDLVLELGGRGRCGSILHSYAEEDVERLLRSEHGMIGSDGSLARFGEGSPHPRAYGTYPRVLGRYVRERGVLTLEEAVRKMTSFPAERLGLEGRGLVREGYVADLVAFDPQRIADRATFEDPHQYPVGVEHVLVGGTPVLEAGVHTGALPGRVLRGPGTGRDDGGP